MFSPADFLLTYSLALQGIQHDQRSNNVNSTLFALTNQIKNLLLIEININENVKYSNNARPEASNNNKKIREKNREKTGKYNWQLTK